MKFTLAVKISLLMLLLSGCACRDLTPEDFLVSEENLKKDRFKNDTLYILFDDEYLNKKNYSFKQPKLELDSVSGIHYSLRRNAEYLTWEHSITYMQLGEEGFYLVHSDSLESIEASIIPSEKVIAPLLLKQLEDREVFRNLVNKMIYILEPEGRCTYKKVPVNFRSGHIYAEEYE